MPLFEVVGQVQVGYGIIDGGHLVEVTEFKRNPMKGEKRTETFKVPVSNCQAYVGACGRGAMTYQTRYHFSSSMIRLP
jgi:hypothetical protein